MNHSKKPENVSGTAQKPGKIKKITSKNRFKHGGMSTIFTVIFLVAVILVNVIFSMLTERYPSMKIDLTAQKTNSLSTEAIKVAKDVKKPTEIYIIASEDSVKRNQIFSQYGIKYSQVGTLCSKLAEKNPQIKVQYIDPDKNPSFISKYASDNLSLGKILVKTENRYRVLGLTDLFDIQYSQDYSSQKSYSLVDSALATAINQVNLKEVPIAAIATGHDEALTDKELASFTQLLKNANFDVKTFNILTDKIPGDTQLLVLPTPNTDYTQQELDKMDAYLSNPKLKATRSVLVTCHPQQAKLPHLSAFLEEWGMKVHSGAMVVESDNSHQIGTNPGYILSKTTKDIKLGGNQDYPMLATPASCDIDLLFKAKNDISTYSLATSYPTGQIVTADKDGKAKVNPQKKEYTTIAMGQKQLQLETNTFYTANVIVMGSSYALMGDFLNASTFSNNAYITDLVKYATNTTNTSNQIITKRVQTNVNDITAPLAVSRFLGLGVFTIMIPLAVLIAGIVVFMKRRHL